MKLECGEAQWSPQNTVKKKPKNSESFYWIRKRQEISDLQTPFFMECFLNGSSAVEKQYYTSSWFLGLVYWKFFMDQPQQGPPPGYYPPPQQPAPAAGPAEAAPADDGGAAADAGGGDGGRR